MKSLATEQSFSTSLILKNFAWISWFCFVSKPFFNLMINIMRFFEKDEFCTKYLKLIFLYGLLNKLFKRNFLCNINFFRQIDFLQSFFSHGRLQSFFAKLFVPWEKKLCKKSIWRKKLMLQRKFLPNSLFSKPYRNKSGRKITQFPNVVSSVELLLFVWVQVYWLILEPWSDGPFFTISFHKSSKILAITE